MNLEDDGETLVKLQREKDEWERILANRQDRVAEARAFIVAKATAIGETERRIAESKREAERYEFFQRTDCRLVYRYDRKASEFNCVCRVGYTGALPGDSMCDAARIARILKDDPYAMTFLAEYLHGFAKWILAVQRRDRVV